MNDDKAHYPIGQFRYEGPGTAHQRTGWIDDIAQLPARLAAVAVNLTEKQLETRYRDGGWTARQVVHHVPDSHMNGYIRFKLALTEEQPVIRPYDEKQWAELSDSRTAPVRGSLELLAAIHARWVELLRGMTEDDFQRTVIHPEHAKRLTLDWLLAQYSWHGRHHLGHILAAMERS